MEPGPRSVLNKAFTASVARGVRWQGAGAKAGWAPPERRQRRRRASVAAEPDGLFRTLGAHEEHPVEPLVMFPDALDPLRPIERRVKDVALGLQRDLADDLLG